jgi:ubiquinone/menaquinone biosynthesis C-methylase UbiE
MTLRDILADIEPEAIPYPFSRLYARLAGSRIFGDFYRIVAGQVPILIASASPMLQVTGVDLSADMVKLAGEEAKRLGLTNVEFRQGNASELPFKDAEFDLVLSTLSFHHWKRPEKGLDEVYRVLREGGEAWIYDVPRDFDRTMFDYLKHKYGFLQAWGLRLHALTEPYYRETDIEQLANESRFRRHEITHTLIAYKLILYK